MRKSCFERLRARMDALSSDPELKGAISDPSISYPLKGFIATYSV